MISTLQVFHIAIHLPISTYVLLGIGLLVVTRILIDINLIINTRTYGYTYIYECICTYGYTCTPFVHIYILEMQINTINALQVSKSITYNLHSGDLEVQKTPAVDSPTANLNLFTFCEGIERVREEPGVCYSL